MNSISPDTPQKQCSRCPNIYPLTAEFFEAYRKKNGTYGLRSFCKTCAVAERKAYNATRVELRKHRYQQNRTEVRAKAKQHYYANHEKVLAQARGSYAKHAEEIRERQRRFRKEHPEVMYEYEKRRRQKHKDVLRERKKHWQKSKRHRDYQLQYRQEHKEEQIIQRRQHYQSHATRMRDIARLYRHTENGRMVQRTHGHKRRAQKLASGGSHTAQQLREQLKRQKARCYYCKMKLGKIHHIEHVVPLSRGGTNDISNIVIACPDCNMKKGAKLPHEWSEGGRLL